MTIVEFLRDRLDEDEGAARDIAAKVAADPGSFAEISLAHPELAAGDCPSYLGEYDPARVLVQVAAMRAIVDYYDRVSHSDLTTPDEIGALYVCVLYLASVWSSHPDYDPAWALEH